VAIDLMRKFADITVAATGEIAAMMVLAAISANPRPALRIRRLNRTLSVWTPVTRPWLRNDVVAKDIMLSRNRRFRYHVAP
jgi:hypothetical protein